MTARQFGILCVLALTWGCSFLFIKVIVEGGVGAMGMSGIRTLLGALSLVPFAWAARSGFRQPGAVWAIMIGLGVLNFAIPWTLFGVAGDDIPSGVSAVANASAPLWSAILATIFLKTDALGPRRVAGLGVGFLGVVILMAGDFAELSGSAAGSIALILLATLCYATAAVTIRRRLAAVPAVPLAFVQVATAATLLMPSAFATGAFEGADFSLKVVSSAIALGTLGSGVAVVAYMYLIQNVGPVRASIVTYMAPPIGVVLGWLVLNEAIGWNLVAALACILAGVALVQGITPRSVASRLPGRAPAAVPADS